ncbi:MAG: tetratricopeptide repeat protein [Candidatus Omnitrophica bacterium]|nr:tetratricopeptide repeat protein [Candidatus Omnitrophota bacterium]
MRREAIRPFIQFLGRWVFLLRIPIALIGIGLFLAGYNRFILDTNLQNLKTSLSALNKAVGVSQAEAVLLLVDQTLVAEMAKEEIHLKDLASLQYTQGTLASGQLQRPVEDARLIMESLTEDRASARSGFLTTLDGIVTGIQGFSRGITFFPRRIFTGGSSQLTNDPLLPKAARSERLGMFKEAVTVYEKLLKDYPNDVGRSGLRLRLGYLHQRTGAFDEAERLYRQVLAQALDPNEAQVAHQMLGNLTQARKQTGRAKVLEQRLSTIKWGPERQQVAFELGLVSIRLYAIDKAAKAFHEARLAVPDGDLALPALFKEAWCLKTLGQFEEALNGFQEVIHRDPKSPWAWAARHQVAETYRASGDLQTAGLLYDRISWESQDDAFAAVLHTEAGSVYRYDLNDPVKAQLHFQELLSHFPASPFSDMEQKLYQAEREKGIFIALLALPSTPVLPRPAAALPKETSQPSLEKGSLLLGWLEKFLPLFVEVFEERLAGYMKSANRHEMTRKYTDAEFKELVVRRVRAKFPGQITEVDTKIHPDGFVGYGTVHLGPFTFPVEARIGITVVEERPHALIHEVKVGNLSLPKILLGALEEKVNQSVRQQQQLLKIKKYELKEGYADISVELVEKK